MLAGLPMLAGLLMAVARRMLVGLIIVRVQAAVAVAVVVRVVDLNAGPWSTFRAAWRQRLASCRTLHLHFNLSGWALPV
jgi:hypothetical protein